MSKLTVMLFIATILVASVVLTVPAASALEKRNFAYLNDNHLTARYGNAAVCGDHMCAPGEWNKLQASLTAAQLGYQGGRNGTQTSATNTTSTSPIPSQPTVATPNVCNSIKSMLSSAGVSSSIVNKVMADLGCS
jgi:hypothetical protein